MKQTLLFIGYLGLFTLLLYGMNYFNTPQLVRTIMSVTVLCIVIVMKIVERKKDQ